MARRNAGAIRRPKRRNGSGVVGNPLPSGNIEIGPDEFFVGNPDDITIIDPAAERGGNASSGSGGGTATTGSDAPRRRGRPPGSKASANLGAIQAALISVHSILALRIPEMEIEEAEAKTLAEAIARVEQYYPRVSAVVSGKLAAHGLLAAAIFQVYGTRIAAIGIRLKAEREGKSGAVQREGNVLRPDFAPRSGGPFDPMAVQPGPIPPMS